jgi:hypothetical protein
LLLKAVRFVDITTLSDTAFESAILALVAALSAALNTRLSNLRETLPVEICALTALSTVEPAVTREVAEDAPAV